VYCVTSSSVDDDDDDASMHLAFCMHILQLQQLDRVSSMDAGH
jgi:hypothetical protein